MSDRCPYCGKFDYSAHVANLIPLPIANEERATEQREMIKCDVCGRWIDVSPITEQYEAKEVLHHIKNIALVAYTDPDREEGQLRQALKTIAQSIK